MKVKVSFGKGDRLLAMMQVVEGADVDFEVDNDEETYELEVDNDFFEKFYSEEDQEREVRRLLKL